MMLPLAVAMPSWRAIWGSVCSLGFLTGVACSFLVLLICWLIEISRRLRRKNQVLRVKQDDGSELVLTYKAIRTHVRLLLEREFSALILKEIDITGDATKTLRLHVIAVEGVNLAEIRTNVCNRLFSSFKNELGLADTVKAISVDVEEFRKDSKAVAAPVAPPPPPPLSMTLQVPDLKNENNEQPLPADEAPAPLAPNKSDADQADDIEK